MNFLQNGPTEQEHTALQGLLHDLLPAPSHSNVIILDEQARRRALQKKLERRHLRNASVKPQTLESRDLFHREACMQKKEVLDEGHIIHVLQPQANGSSAAACGSQLVVLTIAMQHIPLIPLSAICARCREVLGINERDELRKTLQIAAFLRSMTDHIPM